VKGSGSFSFVSAFFTYDGVNGAILATGSGEDNFGGQETFQCVAEEVATKTSCTAPDGSAGTRFNLVQADCVFTYKQGQLYTKAVGAAAGGECGSNTTTSSGGSITYTVTGGSGKFAGASGSLTLPFNDQTLAAPVSPPGSFGVFGAAQFTSSGSVTY
jgi:hypothetical protein